MFGSTRYQSHIRLNRIPRPPPSTDPQTKGKKKRRLFARHAIVTGRLLENLDVQIKDLNEIQETRKLLCCFELLARIAMILISSLSLLLELLLLLLLLVHALPTAEGGLAQKRSDAPILGHPDHLSNLTTSDLLSKELTA